MKSPLADRMRPQSLSDVVGQKHILGEGKVLYNIIQSGEIPNMIFYGYSGIGKTTLAKIIADKTNKTLYIHHPSSSGQNKKLYTHFGDKPDA